MNLSQWIRNSRMGYISGQSGIIRRMLREEGGWQSHLERTSDYIQQVVISQKPKSVRILGSGWLLDVPMNCLIENCERIVLTDIYHPAQVINKFSKFKNVKFETIDITNGAVDLGYKKAKKSYNHGDFIQQIEKSPSIHFNEDIVISVNLLSQLSFILTDYLSKKLSITQTQVIDIAEAIQKKHLEYLPLNRSVLISDYEEEYYDEDDKLIGSKPTVFIILNGDERKDWRWLFDTKMMYKQDCKTILKVSALRM